MVWKIGKDILQNSSDILTEFAAGAFPARLGGFDLEDHMAFFLAQLWI